MMYRQHGLDGLKEKLLLMAGFASLAVNRAVQAHMHRTSEAAWQIVADDVRIDQLEAEVDQLAIGLLARGPLAVDLRFIMVAMRISRELERVGDEAAAIAHRVVDLAHEPPLKSSTDLLRMATIGIEMLNQALDAFVDSEPDRARAVVQRDLEVDLLNKTLYRELTLEMIAAPPLVGRYLDLMSIAKRLERIADHAKALAESVVYLYEGRDIRHRRAWIDKSPGWVPVCYDDTAA